MTKAHLREWQRVMLWRARHPCGRGYQAFTGRACLSPVVVTFSRAGDTAFIACHSGHAEQRVPIQARCGCESHPLRYVLPRGLIVAWCPACEATWVS